jgi:hypothetical protein
VKAPLVFPDVERAVRALLDELTPAPTTVGIGLPDDWTIGSPPHLQVAQDGTLVPAHRITAKVLVRITAWAESTSVAKALALAAEARLTAHAGDGSLGTIRTAAGMFPARDQDLGAELASFTVNVTVRSAPLD